MESARIDCFFSCSFSDTDREVNDFFRSICIGLDLRCINVGHASASTPPEQAVKMIDSSQLLIAICTRRNKIDDNKYVMPQAVQSEISIAYGKDVPVLMFVEEGVELAGFYGNFGSYLQFDRNNLINPDNIQKFVKSIHEAKVQVLAPHQIGVSQGASDAFAEYVNHLVELKKVDNEFYWEYSNTKKLVYISSSKRGFNISFWSTAPAIIPKDWPKIEWRYDLHSSTRGINLLPIVNNHSSSQIDVVMKLEPNPDAGDIIEYSTSISSRYINPIWSDEVRDGSYVQFDDGEYLCSDGLVCAHRTKKAVIEFRFDRDFKISKNDIRPFVGSYTSTLDYEVPSELKRAVTRIEEFGKYLIIRMEIDSPLPGHMYGLAWNPPDRPRTNEE